MAFSSSGTHFLLDFPRVNEPTVLLPGNTRLGETIRKELKPLLQSFPKLVNAMEGPCWL